MFTKSINLTVMKIDEKKVTLYNFENGHQYVVEAKHFAGHDISINSNIQVNEALLTQVPVE